MLTESITIDVETDTARIYNDAPKSDKEKLQALFGALTKQYAEADIASFKRTMDEMGREAQDNDLTPEMLDSLLTDE